MSERHATEYPSLVSLIVRGATAGILQPSGCHCHFRADERRLSDLEVKASGTNFGLAKWEEQRLKKIAVDAFGFRLRPTLECLVNFGFLHVNQIQIALRDGQSWKLGLLFFTVRQCYKMISFSMPH